MKTLNQVRGEIEGLMTTMRTFPEKEKKSTLYRRLKRELEAKQLVKIYLEMSPSEDSIRKQYEETKRIVDLVDSEMSELKNDESVSPHRITKRREELELIHQYKRRKQQKETLEYILGI